ncbi:hypothetical protein [Kitasatospora sp. HPMI-4]|uniref:hypothetical protein n=1 Tax=Kitasatospora sp. HPMI-4 TaxID=3448443 RepID=UPI003F1BDF73
MNDAFTTDPDLRHLARLLAMLPGRDHTAFWATVNNGAERIVKLENADPNAVGLDYILTKMQSGITHLRKAENPAAVASFGHHLLMFFDGDRPALWSYLSEYVLFGSGLPTFGERYARDLCDTAWRIIARYDVQGDNDLAERWPGRVR